MADFRWTAEQAAALAATRDSLLVANAGTGKTTTVVGKILWLLGLDVGVHADTGEPIPRCPEPCALHEIAAITFTEKAAYDLKRKLRNEIARSERAAELRWEVDRASVGTIHSFCGGILRENALRLGIDPTFRVLDAEETRPELQRVLREVVLGALEVDDSGAGELYRDLRMTQYEGRGGLLGLLTDALREVRWHADRHGPWCDGDLFSDARLKELCGSLTPWTDSSDEDAVRRCNVLLRLARDAQREWSRFLEEENARDFDALILDTRALLTRDAGSAAVAELRRRYRVLIVDEFQDTDRAQRDVVFALGGAGRPQLFLVGDPKQSIYRFRGADVSVWNEVEDELRARGNVFPLTRNFRSAPTVIDFANAVSERAMSDTAAALGAERLTSGVPYAPLMPGRADPSPGAVERVVVEKGNADDRRRDEAEHLAARILELRGRAHLYDTDSGESRPCRFSDIAVLYRANTGIELYERALRDRGIPFFNSQPPNLEKQQEVADLVNALRLVENPRDDLRAFAWLRSPFVGLRDEVIARIRLEGGRGSLLAQARKHPGSAWFDAPEGAAVAELERAALLRGLAALDEARRLSHRLALDELAALLLERSGYRNHLVLLGREREGWANLDAFLRHLEAYRSHLLASFLEIWDGRDAADPGLPQAPLYSAEDDVVTFTTIHRAKGLEWPVVFLVDVSGDWAFQHRTNQLVVDPHLGPALVPKKEGRGARASALERRSLIEERAEEARVLYVAVTRAKERLIVIAPLEGKKYLPWLDAGSASTVAVQPDVQAAAPVPRPEEVSLAWLGDVVRGRGTARGGRNRAARAARDHLRHGVDDESGGPRALEATLRARRSALVGIRPTGPRWRRPGAGPWHADPRRAREDRRGSGAFAHPRRDDRRAGQPRARVAAQPRRRVPGGVGAGDSPGGPERRVALVRGRRALARAAVRASGGAPVAARKLRPLPGGRPGRVDHRLQDSEDRESGDGWARGQVRGAGQRLHAGGGGCGAGADATAFHLAE